MKRYKLSLRDEAVADERDAYFYYEDEQEGLGESFFRDLNDTYSAIQRNPFAFGYADNSQTVRKASLKKFSYLVFYEIGEKEVVVFRVHHTSRKPLF